MVRVPIIRWLATAVGWVVFASAIIIPGTVMVVRWASSVSGASEPSFPGVRQWQLLARTVMLAVGAAGAALLVALPGAYVLGRGDRGPATNLWRAMCAAPLLFPPMVYAFGWQRLLPVGTDPFVQCVLVWTLWAWPIPALIIAAGWARGGQSAYEAALLVSSPARAFLYAALPVIHGHVLLSAMLLVALFLGEYSVPHACGLLVFATELLGWASTTNDVGQLIRMSAPGAGVIAVLLFVVLRLCKTCALGGDAGAEARTKTPPAAIGVLALVVALSVGVPIGALLWRLDAPRTVAVAFRTYHDALAASLVTALLAGVLATFAGFAMVSARRVSGFVLVAAVLFGAMPGALVGASLVSAYQSVGMIYDHWPIVVLGYVARFCWIGILAARLAVDQVPHELVDQARTDGADETAITTRIRLPINWPTGGCAVVVVAALALSEVATTSLVRVPSFDLIALIVIEKFHRFEDGMLISLSLWLVSACIPGAVLLRWASRRGQ